MPKLSDTITGASDAATITGEEYFPLVQGGRLKKVSGSTLAASAIKGDKGDKGDPGEKGDKGDKGVDGTNGITSINLGALGGDYNLSLSESGYITFTAASSVNLNVACGQGEYQIAVNASSASPSTTAGGIYLKPGGYSASAIKHVVRYSDVNRSTGTNSASSYYGDDNYTGGFLFGETWIIKGNLNVSTFTNSKSFVSQSVCLPDATNVRYMGSSGYWSDTSTTWTSLGTIYFPSAQTGTIIIRRIL